MRPKVYLAGPISGCNDEQRLVWREDLKRGFGSEFEFIDPTDNLIDQSSSAYALVQADIEAIQNSDVVLANMWRESIGTAFGILHAHSAGKIVVVCDPNFIGNRMMTFYADAVERSLPACLHSIRVFLKAERQITGVKKLSGRIEPFDRNKIGKAVRRACLDAGQSDIGPPRAIVGLALSNLLDRDGEQERVLDSTEIRESVWQAMAELAADPKFADDFDSIASAWELHLSDEAPILSAVGHQLLQEVKIHKTPLDVTMRSHGTHSTIWGHTVAPEAKAIFKEMARVDGISDIIFGPFKNTNSPPAKPHIRIIESKTPYLIEGVCFDKGKKGTKQTFQIKVTNPETRDAVLRTMRRHLESLGHIRLTAAAD